MFSPPRLTASLSIRLGKRQPDPKWGFCVGLQAGRSTPFPQPLTMGAGSPVGLGQPGLQAKPGPGTRLGRWLRAEDLRVRAQLQHRAGVRLSPGVPLLSKPPSGVSPDLHCPRASFREGPRAHPLAPVSTPTPTWPTALETSISWRPWELGACCTPTLGDPHAHCPGGLSSLHCPEHWWMHLTDGSEKQRPAAQLPRSCPASSPGAPCPALTPLREVSPMI